MAPEGKGGQAKKNHPAIKSPAFEKSLPGTLLKVPPTQMQTAYKPKLLPPHLIPPITISNDFHIIKSNGRCLYRALLETFLLASLGSTFFPPATLTIPSQAFLLSLLIRCQTTKYCQGFRKQAWTIYLHLIYRKVSPTLTDLNAIYTQMTPKFLCPL